MSIKELTGRHEAIMRRFILDGASSSEVCAEFSITPAWLSTIKSSPVWEEKEKEMRREAFSVHQENLNKLVRPAIGALGDCVESEDENVKLRSAKEILDRTGFVPGIKVDVDMKPVIKMYVPKNWQSNGGEDGSLTLIEGESNNLTQREDSKESLPSHED